MSEHDHIFEYKSTVRRKLRLSFSITITVMFIELFGGFVTGSIALISDAGHMFTHSFAIMIGLIAARIALRPVCHHKTFGMYRAEVLGAFVNGVFLIVVVVIILYESTRRLFSPTEVQGFEMMIIAIIGLATNLASIGILHGHHHGDVNVRGVFYHMIADAISSVGVIGAAVVIYYTSWSIIDPLVGIGISMIILHWAYNIMKESGRILLEMAPEGMDRETIRKDVTKSFEDVDAIHHIHVWTIIPNMHVISAHLKLKSRSSLADQCLLIKRIEDYLSRKYHLVECTLQITEVDSEVCRFEIKQ